MALVEAAQVAANSHPHWKAELARLEPRWDGQGDRSNCAGLLVTVWHVLARKVADRFAEPEKVSEKMLRFAYEVGKENRPGRQTAAQFARERLDVLGMGQELTSIPWGSKKPIPLPPSSLKEEERRPKQIKSVNSR